jgi:hypothetical protein
MPIPLGILAAAGVRASAGTYELIETITVGSGGAASVTFSNLNTYSTTYQHLQIRAVGRSSNNNNNDGIYLRFNGDASTSNYRSHSLEGTGSAVQSFDDSFRAGIHTYILTAATSTVNHFGAGVYDILDAYETKNKTVRLLGGRTSSNAIFLSSGVWLNTAAISSATLLPLFGSFVQYSRFSIYGIRGN